MDNREDSERDGSEYRNRLEKMNTAAAAMHLLPTSDEHDTDGEDLLCVGVGRHVAEADAGQAAEGEVERGHVDAADGRAAAGPVDAPDVVVGRLQAFPELMEPSWMV